MLISLFKYSLCIWLCYSKIYSKYFLVQHFPGDMWKNKVPRGKTLQSPPFFVTDRSVSNVIIKFEKFLGNFKQPIMCNKENINEVIILLSENTERRVFLKKQKC